MKKKTVSKGAKASGYDALGRRKTKTPTVKSRKGMKGGSVAGAYRECGVCHKTGHNARSHKPGGKLAKGR